MVTIDRVDKRSLADRLGLRAGDRLVSLNGYEINDVLDYEFYAADSGLRIEYERASGVGKRQTVVQLVDVNAIESFVIAGDAS